MKEIEEIDKLGISAIALFPLIEQEKKDNEGKESYNPKGLVQPTVKAIKTEIPQITVITDIALDPYFTYGHDGIVKDGEILNDETVEVLVKDVSELILFRFSFKHWIKHGCFTSTSSLLTMI